MSAEADREVVAVITDGYVVSSASRGHETLSDEPAALGGTDTAMTPGELLLSALASCKLATMRMVANRREWNTDGLSIRLEMLREEERTTIRQHITFPDHLNEEQRTRLTAVSHKCPVSRIVTGEVVILDNNA